ncbi:MAG: rhodanese-like domain-containing protein [Gammaproteobacteria bacterium]|nr:MAG: rhodanese-like domain-containing protein [Gammaproteobacteria bacterium]
MEEYLEFATRHWALSLAFVGVLGALIITEAGRFTRRFREVSPGRATQLINREDARVLDVSAENEFETAHIINARNIPAGQLASRDRDLKKLQKKPLVVYCRNGQQSLKACSQLDKMGFEDLYWLKGGFAAWQGDNLPVAKGRK